MAFPREIHVDEALQEDSSSEYGTGSLSEYSTESLTQSIYDYQYENGRRYHAYKQGKYVLPNDETEQDRLDIVHHTILLMLDMKLHLAPIDPNPQRILDVGTGTGIWAMDAGEKYPSAEVIGTDLSPIQSAWVPPNVKFQIDDAESEWTFGKDSFDLVHIRHLSGAIVDWGKLIGEVYKHCKPGGWIDITEFEMGIYSDDGTLPDNLELKRYYTHLNDAAEKSGRPFNLSGLLKPLLENAGFTNIHHQAAKLPLGPWAADPKQKELGAYALLACESGFEAHGIKLFTAVLGMELGDAQHLIREALKQAKSKRIHTYGFQHFFYAQKPLGE